MSNTLQTFLADATRRSATTIVEAIMRLPEDRRNWKPAEGARSALDQLAECALNHDYTAELIKTRHWGVPEQEIYLKEKQDLVDQGQGAIEKLLAESTERVVAVILAFPDDSLSEKVVMPFGEGELSGVLAYPYWNMSYHEAQINYIGSILSL